MRVLLDTNVLISALISMDGKPSELLYLLLAKNQVLILSGAIVEEFARVAADKRIRRYVKSEDVAAFLKILFAKGVFVRVKSKFKVLGNADDDILGTAYDGHADLIVSGDKHLLQLGEFKSIKITTVSEALKEISR